MIARIQSVYFETSKKEIERKDLSSRDSRDGKLQREFVAAHC